MREATGGRGRRHLIGELMLEIPNSQADILIGRESSQVHRLSIASSRHIPAARKDRCLPSQSARGRCRPLCRWGCT